MIQNHLFSLLDDRGMIAVDTGAGAVDWVLILGERGMVLSNSVPTVLLPPVPVFSLLRG